jgi:uncharacterized HAD superfamily protein
MVQKLSEVFNSFDTNQDGKISVQELREGLNRVLSASMSDEQATAILRQFDTSGDGALQLDEFQGIEKFKAKFDRILYEERKIAELAQSEAKRAKSEADKAEAISALINNKPPVAFERLASILPFILPFLDSLPYAGYIIQDYQLDSNPVVAFSAYLYILYQTIPFSGLIAFFLFNLLATNLQLNRLIRYNIQLAILLDIALIFPGLIGTTVQSITKIFGGPGLSPVIADLASDITFITFISVLSYAVISSLFGIEPDKIPFITQRIKERVPTTEEFQKFYKEFEEKLKSEENKKDQKDDNDNQPGRK